MPSENKGISMKNILHHHFTKQIHSKMLLYYLKTKTNTQEKPNTIGHCFFLRNHAAALYFQVLPMHAPGDTLTCGPDQLSFQHQEAEREYANATGNSCAKYTWSKTQVSRHFAAWDKYG